MALIVHLLFLQWITFTGATHMYDDGAIVFSHATAADDELDRMERAASGFAGDDGTPDTRVAGTVGILGLNLDKADEGINGQCAPLVPPGPQGAAPGLPVDDGQPNTPNACGHPILIQTSSSSCCNGRKKRRLPTAIAKCCKHNFRAPYNPQTHICIGGAKLIRISLVLRRGHSAKCGFRLYNPAKRVCCQDGNRFKVSDRKGPNDKCCGLHPFDPTAQMCCGGRLSNINGFGQPKCCNRRAYDANTHICCNGRIKAKPPGAGNARCCGDKAFNTATQICCQQPGPRRPTLVDRNAGCYFCNNRHFDVTKRMCCANRIQSILTGSCCGQRAIHPNTAKIVYICCNGRTHRRRSGGDFRCCGRRAYDCNESKCENGRVQNI